MNKTQSHSSCYFWIGSSHWNLGKLFSSVGKQIDKHQMMDYWKTNVLLDHVWHQMKKYLIRIWNIAYRKSESFNYQQDLLISRTRKPSMFLYSLQNGPMIWASQTLQLREASEGQTPTWREFGPWKQYGGAVCIGKAIYMMCIDRYIWMFPKIVGFQPKSSILIGFSMINYAFWGTPIFGNTHICTVVYVEMKRTTSNKRSAYQHCKIFQNFMQNTHTT